MKAKMYRIVLQKWTRDPERTADGGEILGISESDEDMEKDRRSEGVTGWVESGKVGRLEAWRASGAFFLAAFSAVSTSLCCSTVTI